MPEIVLNGHDWFCRDVFDRADDTDSTGQLSVGAADGTGVFKRRCS